MKPEQKKSFLTFGLVLILFAAGVVSITWDGADGRDFLAMIFFMASAVVAVKSKFGQLP